MKNSDLLIGKNGKTCVKYLRDETSFSKKDLSDELNLVIYCIYQYNKEGNNVNTLDSYIKLKTSFSYHQIEKNIQLLILAGVLEVRYNKFGKAVYVFANEVLNEVEEICKIYNSCSNVKER